MAIFHAMSTKTDTATQSLCTLPYSLLLSKAETVTISWASHLELDFFLERKQLEYISTTRFPLKQSSNGRMHWPVHRYTKFLKGDALHI